MSPTNRDRMNEQLPPMMDREDIRRILAAVLIIAAFALVEVGLFWFTTQGPSFLVGSTAMIDRRVEPRYDPPSVEVRPAAYTFLVSPDPGEADRAERVRGSDGKTGQCGPGSDPRYDQQDEASCDDGAVDLELTEEDEGSR